MLILLMTIWGGINEGAYSLWVIDLFSVRMIVWFDRLVIFDVEIGWMGYSVLYHQEIDEIEERENKV